MLSSLSSFLPSSLLPSQDQNNSNSRDSKLEKQKHSARLPDSPAIQHATDPADNVGLNTLHADADNLPSPSALDELGLKKPPKGKRDRNANEVCQFP